MVQMIGLREMGAVEGKAREQHVESASLDEDVGIEQGCADGLDHNARVSAQNVQLIVERLLLVKVRQHKSGSCGE